MDDQRKSKVSEVQAVEEAKEDDNGEETEEKRNEETDALKKPGSIKKKTLSKDSQMCHQCQRNDKGRVVNCTSCRRKRYCIPCISSWYPKMLEEETANACPVCWDNCNCKACLRMDGNFYKLWQALQLNFSENEKLQYSKYLLRKILPYIKQFSKEQMIEKEKEAQIQGSLPLKIKQAVCHPKEHLYCNNCNTLIMDFHRTCPYCNYNLCLICCQEMREGHLQGGKKEVTVKYVERDIHYMHGEPKSSNFAERKKPLDSPVNINCKEVERVVSGWKANGNGSIPCPPKDFGGCGGGLLELRCMFEENAVLKLVEKAEKIAINLNLESMPEIINEQCPCHQSIAEIDLGNCTKKQTH